MTIKELNNKNKVHIIIGLVFVLTLVFIGIILTSKIVVFKSQSSTATKTSKLLDQFNVMKESESSDLDQKKLSSDINNDSSEPGLDSPINFVLSSAGQDNPGGPVIIKVLLADAKEGTCNFTITNNMTTKKYSSQIVLLGNYYGCGQLDIPANEIPAGIWDLTVNIESGERSGTTSQQIVVKDGRVAPKPISLYITPQYQQIAPGNTFTIDLRANSDNTEVSAVRAKLAYNPNILEYLAYDNSGTAFPVEADLITSNIGEIIVAKGSINPVTGDNSVIKLTFKVLANGRDTLIDVKPSSILLGAYSQNNLLSESNTLDSLIFTY